MKELCPGGSVEGKPVDVPLLNLAIGAMSPQNSDLAILKTSNVSQHRTAPSPSLTACHHSSLLFLYPAAYVGGGCGDGNGLCSVCLL